VLVARPQSSRAKAVGLGALSGMSEPFGAFLASLVANEASSPAAFGAMFGLTGGMMVYVCIAELLPAAFTEKGVSREAVTAAFLAGCLVMAASLVTEKYAVA
jgi:ZIP family zinc transporter